MTRFILILCALVAFSSCSDRFTVMKRKHQKGYYIAFSKQPVKSAEARLERPKKAPVANEAAKTEVVVVAPPAAKPVAPTVAEKTTARAHVRPATTHENSSATPGKVLASGNNKHDSRVKTVIRELNSILPEASSSDSDVMLVLLVILAIFVPPLAVYLKSKDTNQWFWITLILCLLSLTFFVFRLGGLLWFIAIILALLYIFDLL